MLTAVRYTTCPAFLHLHVSSLLAQPSTFPMCTCAFVRDNEGDLFAARNSKKVMCHQIKKNKNGYKDQTEDWGGDTMSLIILSQECEV